MTNETPEVTAYWVPGCSSCLRMKEFLEKHDIAFEAVNLAEQPDRYPEVQALGLSAPAVIKGDRGVPGMDLTRIAALVGFDYDPPAIAPPAELVERYAVVNAALRRLTAQFPEGRLDYKSPDRDRSMRELISHAASAIQEFLHATEVDEYVYGNKHGDNGAFNARFAVGGELGRTGTVEELLVYIDQMQRDLTAWWEEWGFDDPLDRIVSAPFGHVTLHEILERGVWHAAQHTRQVQYFLHDRLGVEVVAPLTDADLAGLPLPEGIHA
jgi:glutaredoxin